MIASMLPACAVGFEAYESEWKTELLSAEAAIVAGAVEKRRREFAAARNCARLALARIGWPNFPVLAGPNREPLWPPGVAGSITHCGGFCAAAVARQGELRGLGIDAERNVPLPDRVLSLICTESEQREMAELAGLSVPMLIFSAKESVYKAWYPITGRWLDYQDAVISLDVANHAFSVRLLASAPQEALRTPITFCGRFAATPDHLFTVVTVPA
jgi:4'-phosphopantetheinyl transferase EntD